MGPTMIEPLESNIPAFEAEAISFTSRIVFVMRKLKFFSKIGPVIWPLLGLATIFYVYLEMVKWPSDIAEFITNIMFFTFFINAFFIPISVFVLERRAPDLFSKRNLDPPLYGWFMALPFVINAISKGYVLVLIYPSVADQPTGKVAIWFATQITSLVGTSVYYAIPAFFYGVMAANFIEECKIIHKARDKSDDQTVKNGTKLLEVYSSLQEGTQFGLFSQFAVHTLLIICLGFQVAVSGKCVALDSFYLISYATALLMSVIILCYFGFIMDDCFQRFQGITDALRHVFVQSPDIQFSKEILVLIQKIKEQSPFTALGFFSVDRSTLMAELGTVLTYFVILIQADVCSPKGK